MTMIREMRKLLLSVVEEREELTAALREVDATIAADHDRASTARAALEGQTAEHTSSLAAEKERAAGLEKERGQLTDDLGAVRARESELGARVEALGKDLAASATTGQEQATAIEALEQERDQALSGLATCRTDLETSKASALEATGRQTAEAERATAAALAQCREELTGRAAEAEKTYEDRIETIRSELGDTQAKTQELKVKVEVMSARGDQHEGEKGQWQAAMAKVEEERGEIEAARKTLASEIAALQGKLDSKQEEMSTGLRTFTDAQKWHQQRVEQLEADKASLQGRIDALQTESRESGANHKDLELRLQQSESDLQAARQANDEVTARLQEATDVHEKLKAATAAVEGEASDLKESLQGLQEELAQAKVEFERREGAFRIEQDKFATAVNAKEELHAAERAATVQETEDLRKNNDTLTTALAASHEQGECLTVELKSLRSNTTTRPTEQAEELAKERVVNDTMRRQIEAAHSMEGTLQQANDEIQALKQKLHESDRQRRQLHNKVQDLRGNVRIYVRTRPLLREAESSDPCPILCDADGETITMTRPGRASSAGAGAGGGGKGKAGKKGGKEQAPSTVKSSFSFDKVFGPASTQEGVFNEISELIQSVLDGFNVCLFSYGQTGSGKTFTMSGSRSAAALRGLIPRSVERLFEAVTELKETGWEHTLEVSFIEIYNEKVNDMLVEKPAGAAAPASLAVRVHPQHGPYVEGVSRETITEPDDIFRLMERAERTRAVAATDMNEQSSRSHTICIVNVTARHEERGVSLQGALKLCDLAGSERLSKSKAAGARLKETQHINTSLKSLSDVFHALSQKMPHVPYRNSKLTHILQDCLGGSGKAAMLVALSAEPSSASETLQSLRFAEKVKTTELGKAKKNVSRDRS